MLIIRRSQETALQRFANRSLAAQASASLLLTYPELLDRDDDARLDALADLVGEAQSSGFKLDRNIFAFIEIVLLMGAGFMTRGYSQWIVTSQDLAEDERIMFLLAYAERISISENTDEDV